MKTTQDQFAQLHTRAINDAVFFASSAYAIGETQMWLTKARERLLDAFGKSTDPAPLLRLIEDLAIVQERLSTIKE